MLPKLPTVLFAFSNALWAVLKTQGRTWLRSVIVHCLVMALLLGGFWVYSSSVLLTSIELLEQLLSTDPEVAATAIRSPVEAQEQLNLFRYLFAVSAICFVFFSRVCGRDNIYVAPSLPRGARLSILQPQIPYLLIAVLAIGFCVQLGMINPLYPRLTGNGFSRYTLDFELLNYRHPLILPSLALMLGSLYFLLRSRVDHVLRDVLRSREEVTSLGPIKKSVLRIIKRRERFDIKVYQSQTGVLSNERVRQNLGIIGPLVLLILAYIFLAAVAATGSAFSTGTTFVEVPKLLILVIIACVFVHYTRNRPFEHQPTFQFKREGIIISITTVFSLLIAMAGDVGSLLIVGYSGLVMSSVWYLANSKWRNNLAFWLYSVALLLTPLMKWAPLKFLDQERRFREWRMGDGVFIHSGIGEHFLPGTASSPDFARAEWSLASAGWFGRGTGLFVDANQGDPFAGYLAYGYNDRAIIALTETFGFTGLVLIMAVYLALIVSLLAVYAQTFKGFNKLVSGIALATAAIIFGQMVVHVGGNLGLLPFTGIVLPFVSHGTLSNLMLVLLICVVCSESISVLYDNIGHEEDLENRRYFGVGTLLVLTVGAIVLLQGGYKLVIEAPSRATHVRYGIQQDLSIKKVYNPRLYVLTDTLDVKASIEDRNHILLRNSDGEYQLPTLASDRHVLQFINENRDEERGFGTEPVLSYTETVCTLHGLNYRLFGSVWMDSEVERQKLVRQTYARKRYFPPLPEEACVIPEAPVTGELFELLGIGEPIDPSDASKGCAIGGTEHSPGGELIVARYDLEGKLLSDQDTERAAARCEVRRLFAVSQELTGSTVREKRSFWRKSCKVPTFNRAFSSTQLSARAESRKDVIDGSVSFDGDSCTVQLTTAGCRVGEAVIGGLAFSNVDAGIAAREIYYTHPSPSNADSLKIDRRLTAQDNACRVLTYSVGELQQEQVTDELSQLRLHKRTTKSLDSEELNLKRFARANVQRQLKLKAAVETRIKETTLMTTLDGALQNKVREVLQRERKAGKYPAIQALIFDTTTGQVLSQAQATAPRADLKALAAVGDYQRLFRTDQGEYGFGRNTLSSYLLPASTFKIYHALAALLDGKGDAVASCNGRVDPKLKDAFKLRYKPEIAEWTAGINCNGQHYGYGAGKKKTKALTLEDGIAHSCNHYFIGLGLEHGSYPASLQKLCERGLPFGRSDGCRLSKETLAAALSAEGRSAGQDTFGQGSVLFNVYQLAELLQAVSTNRVPKTGTKAGEQRSALCTELTMNSDNQRCDSVVTEPLIGLSSLALFEPIYKGMKRNYVVRNNSKKLKKLGVRIYGKTGTGQDPLHRSRLKSRFIDPSVMEGVRKPLGNSSWCDVSVSPGEEDEPCWIRDYERAYGVTKAADHALFIALIEDADHTPNQIGTPRIGMVVRVPRGGSSATAGAIAMKLLEEAVVPLKLIPQAPRKETSDTKKQKKKSKKRGQR